MNFLKLKREEPHGGIQAAGLSSRRLHGREPVAHASALAATLLIGLSANVAPGSAARADDFHVDELIAMDTDVCATGGCGGSSPTLPPASTINFCNKTSELTIYAVYVSYDGPRGWTSHGWYKVLPGSCRNVSVKRPYTGDVFVYGQAGGTKWGAGDANFCVNAIDAFDIPRSDQICNGSQYKQVQTTKFSIRPGLNTWNFRP